MELAGPTAMSAAVGALAGLFFGTWAAFVRCSRLLDELEMDHEPAKG